METVNENLYFNTGALRVKDFRLGGTEGLAVHVDFRP